VAKCTKTRYGTEAAAQAAGGQVKRATHDMGYVRAYRCDRCRFPDGQRAWHWGHRRPTKNRKKWR
jgi:hypothetical protein